MKSQDNKHKTSCTSKTPRKPKIYTVETIDIRSHAFNVGIAIDFSPEMALWLGHLAFWAEKNLANEKHIHDGLVWCYDTLDALCEYFPYFTRRQIETIISNSVKEGLVKIGNYNRAGYDRTNWYALTPKAYFYFQHLITEKYLKLLFGTISQICEMDFTDLRNGFHRSVTTIPDTTPYPDPDKKSVGETPHTATNVKKFPTIKEINEKAAFESEPLKEFFKNKFAGLTVNYDDLFESCREYYESKRQWVTIRKWKAWIEREKLDNYSKKDTNYKKAPADETEDQRKERQYFTYELIKEKEDPEYTSKGLQQYPEMRQKYSHYAR